MFLAILGGCCFAFAATSVQPTTQLGCVEGLAVVPSASAFTFKQQGLTPRDFGQRLGVRYLVVGSVRRAGTAVRVRAELIEVATGAARWSDQWLDVAYRARWNWMPWLDYDPAFAPIRPDPRFSEWLARSLPTWGGPGPRSTSRSMAGSPGGN